MIIPLKTKSKKEIRAINIVNQWKEVEELRCLDQSKNQMKKRGKYTYQRERGIKAGVAWLERMKQSHERRRERASLWTGIRIEFERRGRRRLRVREGERKEENKQMDRGMGGLAGGIVIWNSRPKPFILKFGRKIWKLRKRFWTVHSCQREYRRHMVWG